MRAPFMLSYLVCLAIAKPQLGYDYTQPVFQSNGLQSFASTPLHTGYPALSGQPLPTLTTPALTQSLGLPLPTLPTFASRGSLQQDVSLYGQQPYYAPQSAQSSLNTYFDNSITETPQTQLQYTTENQKLPFGLTQFPSIELQQFSMHLAQNNAPIISFDTQTTAGYEATTLKPFNGYDLESGQQFLEASQSRRMLDSFQTFSSQPKSPVDIAPPALRPVNIALDQNLDNQVMTAETPHDLSTTELTQQRANIHKHIYVHVPPPDFEEEEEEQQKSAIVEQKQSYNVIFIKAPSPRQSSIIHHLHPQNEDKTIIYVLVKKPEQRITSAIQTGVKHEKPEVYFIKYKAEKGATAIPTDSPAFVEQPDFAQPIVDEQPKSKPLAAERTKESIEAEIVPYFEKRPKAVDQTENAFKSIVPTRSPPAGVSPLPIDLAPQISSKITQKPQPNYLPTY